MIIKEIGQYKNYGLKAWKISSGYHQRSLVESCMFRIKRAFGFNYQQKTNNGRVNEIVTKINI